MNEIFTLQQIIQTIKRGRTGIYALIKTDGFPAPMKIGRSSRWLSNEVNDWIATQAAKPRPLAQAMAALEGGAE
jgi:predicted DNA-binding transcriptional regulator AlpA